MQRAEARVRRVRKVAQCQGIVGVLLLVVLPPGAWAATGCTLDDPLADVARLFPESTDFLIHEWTFGAQVPGGVSALGVALAAPLDPVYERDDTPFTRYTVRREGAVIGRIWGVAERGRYSAIQLIAVEREREQGGFILHRLRSPAYAAFGAPAFLQSLWELRRSDRLGRCWRAHQCTEAGLQDPSHGSEVADFHALTRAADKVRAVAERLFVAPLPPDDRARSERVGRHEDFAIVRQAIGPEEGRWGPLSDAASIRSPDGDSLPVLTVLTDESVFAVADGVAAIFPALPLPDGSTLCTSLLGRVARVLGGERFGPRSDELFDVGVVADGRTGSTFSLLLGRAVAGPRTGEEFRAVGVVLRSTLGELRSRWPTALWYEPEVEHGRWEAAGRRWSSQYGVRRHGLLLRHGPDAAFEDGAPRGGPRHLWVGSTPVVVSEHPRGPRAWCRVAGGRGLSFVSDGAGHRDRETGSLWDLAAGVATSGPFRGQRLAPVEAIEVGDGPLAAGWTPPPGVSAF